LSFYNKKIINEYEAAFLDSQTAIKAELHQEYKKYVETLFSDSKDLHLPTLEGLKDTIESISLNLDVTDEDIATKEVVTGTRTVSDSTWWNPFSWGDTREVNIWGTEEYINLSSLWEKQLIIINGGFNELVSTARGKVEGDKLLLINKYLAFLECEFTDKFNAILQELENLVSDATLREEAIKTAKLEIKRINEFESKLESVLEL
jgi:hypothetical protein